ncbi:MAG: capsular biosynthesis protein [Aquificota bacterium]|nr:MAG: capsular biosynthesis protein [Aquificota bacterium]
MEKLLRLPVLGVVPSITLKKRKKEEKADGLLIDFYAVNSPKSPAAEAFRMVRTSLMLAAAGQPPKTVLVTSPQVGGGKTLIALNLAAAYAQMESRVLLVDCDLRRARLHRVLNVKANPGLSNYLAGRVDLGQIVHQVDGILGDGVTIDFISAGTVPPNPVELLNSKSFVHLLELLRERYDHIVMDSPPLVGFADALVLSRLVDGTILVLRNQQTPKPAAKYARDRLFQVGGNILGVVVNDVRVERGAYYYGKYSGYYYYYSKYYSYGSSPELPGKS